MSTKAASAASNFTSFTSPTIIPSATLSTETLNSTVFITTNVAAPTSSEASSSALPTNTSTPNAPQFVASASGSVFVTKPVPSVTTIFSLPSSSSRAETQPSTSGAQNGGLSTTAVAGLSLGLGLLVGLFGATLIYLYRRRRADKNGRSGQPRGWTGRPDDEALLGHQNQEKQPPLDNLALQPVAVPPAHARIMDWVQRTRATSMSSKASSYFPIIESEPSVARSNTTSTLMRSPSMASSRSIYSQASALPSRVSDEDHGLEGGLSRPPPLYRISE